MSAAKSSWAYTHDISPPSNGHIYDVKLDTVSTHSKDIDYQTEMTQLSVSWEGFHDPHSVIKYYNVHIGKCPGCNDVIVQQYVGIHTGNFAYIERPYVHDTMFAHILFLQHSYDVMIGA